MIFLISPADDRSKRLGAFAKYVPLSPPYAIGALAAYLEEHGYACDIMDDQVEPVTQKLLEDRSGGFSGEKLIFGISCLTAGFRRGCDIARLIRECKWSDDAIIVFGGIHPTVVPEEVLETGLCDIVVRNEGEHTLTNIADAIFKDGSWRSLDGISYLEDGRAVHNKDASLVDINTLPMFPYERFSNYSSQYALGFITSSRGCPHECIFCSQRSISGKQYRFRDPETIMDEIRYLHHNHGFRYITFQDDNFLANRKRVNRLCEMIHSEFGDQINFDCQARGDRIDADIIGRMKQCGFRLIHVGIETASDKLLELVNKGETLQQIVDGVRLVKAQGLGVSGTFIFGLPGETPDDRRAAYELAKELRLDYVRFNNATPYPGTRLNEIATNEGVYNPGESYQNLNACGSLVQGAGDTTSMAYVPEGMDEKSLRHDLTKYNLLFSLNPVRVCRLLFARVGPAGWFELPEKWFLNPKEVWNLLLFCCQMGLKLGAMIISILTRKRV